MRDVIVVGGGILGATIGQAFRVYQDRDVVIYDDERPMRGTYPSGGCIKPSSLTGLDDEGYKISFEVLDELYGLEEIKFAIKPVGKFVKVSTYQMDMDKYLEVKVEADTVKELVLDGKHPAVRMADDRLESCEVLVVAAGIWCNDLLPKLFPKGVLKPKTGVSFLFDGSIEQPFVQSWAPYKQITIHNIVYDGETNIWASDGSALLSENWTDERTQQCLKRIKGALKRTDEPWETSLGYRPFHKAKPKPCYLEEIQDNVWVVTGAGKYGCISAGWAADRLLEDA